MKTLKITKEISLPLSGVTETFAAIGRRGAGKSYLATMIAEQMLDAHAQVVVIDPVGIWWGLRVGADGKSKGKQIFVIGGEHGDVPIVPEAGKRVAQLIVEKGASAIIDVSGFRIGEHKRFSADFAEEFFHLKKTKKTPVHLFIEEAQTLIPQRVGPDEARMVGAFERIVRLGRNYGIGCTLVTQRPQSVNKEVLSQVECLFVLQITGLHERKALEDWVQEKDADRKLIGELPSLERGEGYVWSPAWLKLYKRVHFSKKDTFDASATPEVGKETKAARLSAVDVEVLKKDMADVVEKAEQDDPTALRRKLHEAQRQKPAADPKALEQAEERGYKRGLAEGMKETKVQVGLLADAQRKLSQISSILNLKDRMFFPQPVKTAEIPRPLEIRKEVVKPATIEPVGGLSNPEQRILNAIAWLESIGVGEPEQTAVAFLAGYTFGGGAFNNPKGSLRTKGLVEYVGSSIKLTDTGREVAQAPDEPLTTNDLHTKVLSVLEAPHQRILKPLLERYPEAVSGQELAELSGYTYGAGAFNNPKGRLRSLGLIEYLPGGMIKARDILFVN
jgi:hypothetical protein